MSELITRRTFLKATGAAALAVAASGMLAGCGDGADALLSVSVLPSVSSESYIFADTGYMIGLGSFEDCRSNSQREPGTNSTNKYKATTKRTISTGNSTIPLWVDLGSYFDVPTTHIGGITVTYKNSVTFSYASPSDTPVPKAK